MLVDKSLTMNHNMNRNDEQIVYLPQLERFESSPESGWAFPHFVPVDLSWPRFPPNVLFSRFFLWLDLVRHHARRVSSGRPNNVHSQARLVRNTETGQINQLKQGACQINDTSTAAPQSTPVTPSL